MKNSASAKSAVTFSNSEAIPKLIGCLKEKLIKNFSMYYDLVARLTTKNLER
jgi:hypothetical protein